MKTTTIKKTFSALLLMAGVFFTSAVLACSASFTYTLGVNGQATFTSTSTTGSGYVTYYWTPGDGTGTSYGGTTFSHTYTANGAYKAVLFLSVDSTTCVSTDTVLVTITNITVPCTLSANFTSTVNAGGAVNFTSTSTGTYAGTQYYWNPGDGSPTVPATSTYNHTYIYQGEYGVWLYLKDTGTAYCMDSVYLYVNVLTADSNACHLRAKFTYNLGLNGHVTFNNTSSCLSISNLHSDWKFGDGDSAYSPALSYTHIYTANGIYTVNLTAVDGDTSTCADTTTHIITVTNVTVPCTLSAGFTVINDTTTGQVQLVSISTGTNAYTQYYWKETDTSNVVKAGSSYTCTYSANGTYSAWLFIKDTGSQFCQDSIMEIVNISNVNPLTSSFVTSYTSGDTLGDYNVGFTSTSTGINDVTTYAWEPGDTTAGDTGVNMTTYSHSYKYPGAHTVTLSIWFTKYPRIIGHSSESVEGMYDFSTYSKTVYVGSPAGISTISATGSDFKLYPNPNNGLFRLAISGMGNDGNAEVQITNLLGEVIYSTTASTSYGVLIKDINLPTVSTGTYFVRVITADKVYNTKTIINK